MACPMRSHARSSVPALFALAAILLGPSAALAQQTPTLGQIALKEQERRKALKTPTKVLTTQDLPKTAAPQTPASAPAVPTKDAAADAKASKTEEVKDEAWWRQRITQVREELRRNELFAEALQTRINSLTTDFTNRDDPYQRARIADDRQKAMAEMDRVRAEVDIQKKKIADIEEEARVAGVPPGWLR